MSKKRLIFYILWDGIAYKESYIQYMKMNLCSSLDSCNFIEGKKNNYSDVSKNILNQIKEADFKNYDEVVFVSSDYFGPVFPIDNYLKIFYKGNSDILASFLELSKEDDKILEKVGWDFIIFKNSQKFYGDLVELLEMDKLNNIKEFFTNKEYKFSYLADIQISESMKRHPYKRDLCKPYQLIENYKFPFLNKLNFEVNGLVEHSLQQELRRAFDYIKYETEYNEDLIWEHIIKEYNLYDLKRLLHLEYVLDSNRENNKKNKKKIGAFFHLYYEDLFDESIEYISNLPKNVDIYISTKKENIELYKEKLSNTKLNVCAVIEAGTRGRDAGALLIAFKPYILKYEYFCFLHDKKTTGGIASEVEGETFMDLMWKNLLYSNDYVNNIINLFEENKKLGILSPPLPVMGNYLKSVIGNEWTICFEETQKLGEKLDVILNLDRDKPVFTLSTSFWCRSESLKPILEYNWSYNDFQEEPLDLDGTLNHVIERILIYIAQSKGYYSALLYTNEYSSIYLNTLMYTVDNIFSEFHKSNIVEMKVPIDINDLFTDIISLYKFCESNKHILIYGAGAQAKKIKKRLELLGVEVEYFVVTKKKSNELLNGYEVKEFEEIKGDLNLDWGIVIAMSSKFQNEVVPNVKKVNANYYCINE